MCPRSARHILSRLKLYVSIEVNLKAPSPDEAFYFQISILSLFSQQDISRCNFNDATDMRNIFFAFCLQWILPLRKAFWMFPSIFCSFGKIMGSSAQVFILLPLLLNRSSCAMLIPYLPAIGFGLLTHPTFTGARPAAVRLVMNLFGLLPFAYIRELYINFRNASLLGG